MPRFHLNLFNDVESVDEEGGEFADLAAAQTAATAGGRDVMAAHLRAGDPIDLAHRIEVTDGGGTIVAVLWFRDLVTIIDSGVAPH